MPIKENAKKAVRQAKKHAVGNLAVKTAFKKAVKIAKKALEVKKGDVKEEIRLAQKMLDKAVKKGVLKRNAAARKLSRLVKKVNLVAKK